MPPLNDLWQGNCGCWHHHFIREHFLPLGYVAWDGFHTQGRGLVVCGVSLPQPEWCDWRWQTVGYVLRFVPLPRVPVCLQTLQVLPDTIPDLLARVQQYHPGEQMLLVLHANGDTGIYDLQRLAIAPEECYRQVQRRWSEFCLEPHQHGGFYGR